MGLPSGGSQNASATKNSRSARYSITVPWNVPPSLPSISSENSVGSHSTAYAPSTRGTVTDRDVCHHVASAVGSKNAHITRDGAATMVTDEVNDGFMFSRGPGPANLIGVIVRVLGVDLEPSLDAVAPVLGMRTRSGKIRVGHRVEQLARRQAGGLKREQRVRDRTVVIKPGRELSSRRTAGSPRSLRQRATAAGWPTSSRCRRGDARFRARVHLPGAGLASSSLSDAPSSAAATSR